VGLGVAEHGILSSPEAAAAMSKIDRKLFVPEDGLPYNDAPQIIGVFQTFADSSYQFANSL
jgi:protein-L-isoaspartate(D-aspartate) O-methyltransferase